MRQAHKLINLGLQGGGAHGAFTWGVIDYLLEDGRLDIEGLSATSVGSMNAVVLAQGLLNNDRDEARQALLDFWYDISCSQGFFSLHSWFDIPWMRTHEYSLEGSPFYHYFELITQMFSPYQFNPFNINPMKSIIEKNIDFDAIRKKSKVKLFICATNEETCKVRIFTNPELSVETILASSCLPNLSQSIEIDGQKYWNGGYIGNPAIFPLIYNCGSQDIVIVHLNPIYRRGVPHTASEVLNRINEISFNSTLLREMRAIAFVSKLLDLKKDKNLKLKKMRIHSIRADKEMAHYGVSSKHNVDWDFLCYLRDRGRLHTKKWLKQNFSKIGKESSVDIYKEFL
ncbi:esterase [Legionella steigerwaltii]|uniref:Esterase n=1 Tax=Legionella steigerwaltii TaxID=460 RepID=A0A378L7Y6_9GAMM|nr:patatin-like phospholipase family protein [Legionella steigerwaltii]KTD77524.1 esterase [Legionella steigerwaltii]STY22834.1 esterase [Legionella steigerwaltii]